MRMRKVAIFFIFLCLILMGIVLVSILTRPQFGLEKRAKTRLSEMPGQIELKLASHKLWRYRILNGEFLLQSVGDYGLGWKENRPYVYFPREVPIGLPEIKGSLYYGPYRLSPDESLMVLSVSSKTEYFPGEFVLVNMEERKILFHSRDNHAIDDIAWSPDSTMFAVLEVSSRLYLGISGILRIFIGHPGVVSKFYLSIYLSIYL